MSGNRSAERTVIDGTPTRERQLPLTKAGGIDRTNRQGGPRSYSCRTSTSGVPAAADIPGYSGQSRPSGSSSVPSKLSVRPKKPSGTKEEATSQRHTFFHHDFLQVAKGGDLFRTILGFFNQPRRGGRDAATGGCPFRGSIPVWNPVIRAHTRGYTLSLPPGLGITHNAQIAQALWTIRQEGR